jgi:Protein of unknown function (DUF3131)
MNFVQGLKAARSRIVIIVGLLTSISIISALDKTDLGIAQRQNSLQRGGKQGAQNVFLVSVSKNIPAPAPSDLTPEEQAFAGVAWKYFERNYQPSTGLVNSVDQYPASTMWDTGSYLMGVISAYKLGIIPEKMFKERVKSCLQALATLPLFDNELPNKSYNTLTKAMANYDNTPSLRGIGWSAIDVGRLFVPLNIIIWKYSEFAPDVRSVLKRLKFQHLIQEGTMYGAMVGDSNRTEYPQEGRIGYEEYAAKSYSLMGTDVFAALKYDDFLNYENIYGVQVPTDNRNPDRYKAFNYVVSESYILDGVEFGFDQFSREFAYRVYQAQEQRFERTGILTAVSEDNIDTVPYFVYNTVFTDGKAWNCLTDKGEDVSKFRSLSTKAVFGWYALYRTGYTKQMLAKIAPLNDPEKGWYSGLYEVSGKANKAITCNTNAIILEALCYKKFGPHLNLLN